MAPKPPRKTGRKAGGRKTARKGRTQRQGTGTTRTQRVTAPVAIGNVLTTPMDKSSLLYRGCERLEMDSIDYNDPGDNEVSTIALNPLEFTGTRLATEAENWSEFKFTQCEIKVITSNPTSIGGSYVHAIDLNVDSPVVDNPAQYIGQLGGATSAPYYQSSGVRMPSAKFRSNLWFKVDADGTDITSDNTQALYRLATESSVTGLSGGKLTLVLWVNYVVEFAGRKTKAPPPPQTVDLTVTKGDTYVGSAPPGTKDAGYIGENGWGALMVHNAVYAVNDDQVFAPLLNPASPPIKFIRYITGDVQVYGWNDYESAMTDGNSSCQGTGFASTVDTFTFKAYLVGQASVSGRRKAFRNARAKSSGNVNVRFAKLSINDQDRGCNRVGGVADCRGNQQPGPAIQPVEDDSDGDSVIEVVRRVKKWTKPT